MSSLVWEKCQSLSPNSDELRRALAVAGSLKVCQRVLGWGGVEGAVSWALVQFSEIVGEYGRDAQTACDCERL